MAVRRSVGFALWMALGYAVLFAVAMRHLLALLRLGIRNANVLRRYRRKCTREFRRQSRESVRICIELPERGAEKLLNAHHTNAGKLVECLYPFTLLDVRREPIWYQQALSSVCAFARRAYRVARWPGRHLHETGRRLMAIARRLRQFAKLFKAFPFPEELRDERFRQWLVSVYHRVKDICSVGPPEVDPLTAPPARILQGAATQYAFGRLFGLRLSQREVAVMNRYGSVTLAVKRFLEDCGCPDLDYVPAYESLQWCLLRFLESTAERYKAISRRRRLFRLAKEARTSLGFLRSIPVRVKSTLLRAYWTNHTARQKTARRLVVREMHAKFRAQILDRLQPYERTSQSSLASILGFEMQINAISALAELSSELTEIESEISPESSEVFHEHAFQEALDALEHNYTQFAEGE